LYNGHFFTPEREFVTSAIPASQRTVNGVVRLKLYKGNVVIEGRSSDEGLYDEKESSMDELGGFEPSDTTGFVQIESIRIKKMGTGEHTQGTEWGRAKGRVRYSYLNTLILKKKAPFV